MITQFFTIGLLMLFQAMLPGPDFALVTKNTITHSRRAGIFTAWGIGCAALIHMTYCILGIAVVISNSLFLFDTIKYIGATYLIYLGITSLLSKYHGKIIHTNDNQTKKPNMSDFTAFRQGYLCNILNPKATIYFLALFTVIIKPNTPLTWEVIYAVEMFVIIVAWFCSLTVILSHPAVVRLLNKVEKYILKIVGVFLLGFGIALFFITK